MREAGKTDIMIDIETFGRAPDGALASIGAVAFDIDGPIRGAEEFYVNINPSSSIRVGMRVDAATMDWWAKQSPEAQEALTFDRHDIRIALGMLSEWCAANAGPDGIRMWSHATFDSVILDTAYGLCKLQKPWHYRDVLDLRTLSRIWRICGGTDKSERVGTAHNALDDARNQAVAAGAMMSDIQAYSQGVGGFDKA